MSCEIIQFSTAAQAARTPTHQPAAAEVTAIGVRVLTPRQLRRAVSRAGPVSDCLLGKDAPAAFPGVMGSGPAERPSRPSRSCWSRRHAGWE
jgi:hypothetical protein